MLDFILSGVILCYNTDMLVLIDGENFRQNLAAILADEGIIDDKDVFFKYDIAGLLKDVLDQKNLDIHYYASEIKTPKGYMPNKNTMKRLTKIKEKMRKWVPMLKQQNIDYIKAGNLKVKEGKTCRKCRLKNEILQEKGVDVRIALDILESSIDKRCKELAIVSSDTDLCPAYHKSKKYNTKLIYICFASKVNRAVSAVCNETITITTAKLKKYFIEK